MAERITCQCPRCRTHYRVPGTAEGHRARCRSCGAVFRVASIALRPPTEEDILRWLQEAEEQEERAEQAAETAEENRTSLAGPSSSESGPEAAPDTGRRVAAREPSAPALRVSA